MTTDELIEYLQKLPKGTVIGVTHRIYSDIQVLEEDQIEFFPVTQSVLANEMRQPPSEDELRDGSCDDEFRRFVLRNGKIMRYDSKQWDANETPQFVSVIVLPGN